MIRKIAWSDSIRTGNHYIDLQHQELIDLINELASHVSSGQSTQQVMDALQQLERYALFHFNTEENMMTNQRIGGEHAMRHMQAHQEFFHKIQALRSADPLTIQTEEVVSFLVDWLIRHIMHTDQELALLLAR